MPAGAIFPVCIQRGVAELAPPISVAQVSAFAAAIDPAKAAANTGAAYDRYKSAANEPTPPFASVCLRLRRGPSTDFRAFPLVALWRRPMYDNALELAKNANSTLLQRHAPAR